MSTGPSEEQGTEEVVLTRWEKLKQWWEMGSTLVKVISWALKIGKWSFLGTTAAVVVGEVTDTRPARDAAIEIGLIEPDPIDTTSGMLTNELIEQLADIRNEILASKKHTHDWEPPAHEHEIVWPEHTHNYAEKEHGHKHSHSYAKPDHIHPQSDLSEELKKKLEELIPENHMRLH